LGSETKCEAVYSPDTVVARFERWCVDGLVLQGFNQVTLTMG
jgi:hypothetical protein